ncbi:hypothetical protein HYW75_00785 [Candidatus Pacearchaeota archaeon]|nr:hypothetical protein [Candidatus Pacearchaeota archaeon]
MKFKKSLASLVLTGALGFYGCTRSPKNYVEGEVVERYGTLSGLVESSDALFGNESVKIEQPSYLMRVNTKNGEYIIQVDALDDSGSSGPQTIHNIAAATKIGTKIKFPTKAYGTNRKLQPAGFSSGNVGMLDPDDIQILKN